MATTSTPISSSGAADRGIERFNATERWLHWAVAGPLTLAILTGVALFLPGTAKFFGSRELLRVLHWIGGFGSVLIPLMIVLAGDRKRLAVDVREVDLWSRDDRAWMRGWLSRRAGLPGNLPPAGRFNAGQKVNAVFSAAALVWLGLTGVVLFPPLHAPFWMLENSRNLHNITAFLVVPLVLGHVFLSAIYPPTRPGLPGVFTGYVPRAWLRQHHPRDDVSGTETETLS